MAPAATKRRSHRQAATRKRSKYVDPDTDDDFETSDAEADYSPDPLHVADEAPAAAPAPKRRKVARKTHRPQTRSKAAKSKPRAQTRIIGQTRKPRATASDKAEARKFKGPSDGKIPDWTSLPLSILRDVFVFASQPLDSDSVSWLHKAAHTCRGFATPALEAYYYSPAILNTLDPHRLLELLRIRDDRYVNYNTKVKSLVIDMPKLSYTAHNRSLFDLSELVAELPQLQELEVINPIDLPPYRRIRTQQWYYPANLFQTLEEHGQRLKVWRWSRDMVSDPSQLYPHIASVHEGKAFERLESLYFCGFDVDDSPSAVIKGDYGEDIVLDIPWTVSKLPSVKDITFISCNLVRDDFLTRLPATLERLELVNCWRVNSDMLSKYLAQKGSKLKELVLRHNVTLNLKFLTELATSCPQLETLYVDGHYYSERVSINDAEPEYAELLSASDVPTWPATLRHLSLLHLQKWSQEAGTNFFRSLVDGAPTLLDLRHLAIQAHIDIPWRDRAGFRDMWTERVQRVFLRRGKPPHPYHGSKRQFELWKQVKEKHGSDEMALDAALNPNRVSHVQISPHKPSGDTDTFDSDTASSPVTKAPPTRRSTRVKHSQPSTEHDSTSDNQSDDASGDENEEGASRLFVQGLCHVVDVRIDNQRPRENMFTEQDFLDSERSGDEDWNEGADMEFEDNRYAW